MKTNLFIAALSLVVLAGCSGEDEIDTLVAKSDNAITFGTYVGKQTKATEKSAFGDNDEFGVFAFYTKTEKYANTNETPNFMYEQAIKKGAGDAGWTYSPLKYWPNTNGEKITFFAYYPQAKTGMTFYDKGTTTNYTSTSKGFPDIKFVVADAAKDQVDFMYSTKVDETKPTATNTAINFNFAHALSKVNIKAQMSETLNNTTTVNITSIALNNIYNTNTLKYTGSTPSWGWDTASNEKTYTINLSNTKLTNANGTDAIDITSKDTSFLMVPQTLSTTTDKEASITITYDVVTTDTNLSGGSSTITNTVTKQIATEATTWVMNKQYVYTIEISLTDVSVNTEITGWETK